MTHVNEWCKYPWPTIAKVVDRELSGEFGANGVVKALATLNQLHKKGLIKKGNFATTDAGNISAFYPRTWEGCTTMTTEKYVWLVEKLGGLEKMAEREKLINEAKKKEQIEIEGVT